MKGFLAAVFAGAVVLPTVVSAGIIVRPSDCARVWQTALEPSEPIKWPWNAFADRAELVVSNEVSGVVANLEVVRGDDDIYGSYVVPDVDEETDCLFSFELKQYALGKLLSTDRARVAFTPGVAGGKVTVRSTRRSVWRKAEPVAVFAYDTQWAGKYGVEPVSLSWASGQGASGVKDLEGASGWGVIAPDADQTTELSLFFGANAVWSGVLRLGVPGLHLIVK